MARNEIIQYLIEKQHPVTALQICHKFDIPNTALVRGEIHALRVEGYAVCSGPSGYWIARTDDEIIATVAQLRYRAMSILSAATAMSKCVIGQIGMEETDE